MSILISDILKDRDCGFLSIKSVTTHKEHVFEIWPMLGLHPKHGELDEIDRYTALSILKTILWMDLAYRGELILEAAVETRANYLAELLTNSDSSFYTNGNWQDLHTDKAILFNNCSVFSMS